MALEAYRRNGTIQTELVGSSTISGVLSVNGVPSSREILLMDMDAKVIRRITYSDSSGNYSFTKLSSGTQWLLLSIDSNGIYNAVVRSHLTT